MTLSRCFGLAIVFGMATTVGAQTSEPPSDARASTVTLESDERASKLAERYKAMLLANPVEGIALDRLWKAWEDHDATVALIADCQRDAEHSGSAPAWLVAGHVLKKAGRFDEAATAYERAGRADPGSVLPLLAQGDLALARHQPDRAASMFDVALTKMPSNDHRRVDLLMKLGTAWAADGQLGKASQSWEQIVASDPSNLALRKQLAETYVRSHLTDQALVHYEYLDQHADAPARAAALREVGRLRENRGEFDAAQDAFERGLALTSRDNWLNSELQSALIRLYERAGRGSELAVRWRRAAEENPRDLGGFLRLEALAEAQGDANARREWLEKIVALAPRDHESRLKLARLFADTGEREKAAALYDQLIRDQPEKLDLLLARADLDLQLGQASTAISRLEARLATRAADETVTTPILEFFLARRLDEPAERVLRTAASQQPAALEPSVALARFYFARRRIDVGRRILEVVAAQPGSATARAERWQRLAATYRDENLPDDALRCWEAVEKLLPQNPAPRVAASEILLARGDSPGAADALRRALEETPDGSDREEIEYKLFQVLSGSFETAAKPGSGEVGGGGRRRSAMGTSALAMTATVPGGPLDRYLLDLGEAATRHPTAAAYLRLARWQTWARAGADAAAAADKALSLDPGNIPARGVLASVATDAHQHDVALSKLREMVALDPVNQPSYLRQIANLQMEDGNFDAALDVYRELQEGQPGSLELLTELGLAQQRADHWLDALATWKRADALPSLTPAQRTDVRRSLVAAYEHLGEFHPAAEMLRKAVDDQPDLARQQELFRELGDFCAKHALSDWLSEEYERRLQSQPDDYFTMVAVAGIRRSRGREREAYRLLARAYYSAPDPVFALKSLADEAESVGEDQEALSLRRKLVGMAGQNTAENLEKLASVEESNLGDGSATHTWEQVVALFPRDTAALAHAAEFFERNDQRDRARNLLAQVVSIDPGDLKRLLHLAELDRDAGDGQAALARFGELLARSESEKTGDPLLLPPEFEPEEESGVGSGGFRSFHWLRTDRLAPKASGGEERMLRLSAIRESSLLLAGSNGPPGTVPSGHSAARKQWLDRWTAAAGAGARSEALQAFYASGEKATVMDMLGGWQSQQPFDERLCATFLLAGLRLGDYGRLALWAWPEDSTIESAVRGPLLVDALQRFLAAGGKSNQEMVGALFPRQVKARDLLWKAAREGFAERRWYAQAAELGERVVSLVSSGRGAYAVETAQWDLWLGNADRARAVLGAAIAEGSGSSYDGLGGSAVFQALRAYYLLLPVADRSAFVDDYLRKWQDRGEPIHRLLSSILLHGLQGEEETARRELDTLLAMGMVGQEVGGSPDGRRWNFLLVNGLQLHAWNLDSLAIYLWQKSLRTVTAFDRQNVGVNSILADIRSRLVNLQIATATDPEAARERVTAYLLGDPPMGAVAAGATQLMASSQFAAARQFYEYLTGLEPEDGDHWRNLIGACESEGDMDAKERVLGELLDGSPRLPPALDRAELVRQLAMLRRDGGDPAGAIRLLEHEFRLGTRAAPVTTSLALEYERADLLDEATRVWREGLAADPGNAREYRLALARLAEKRGDLPTATILLETDLATKPVANQEEALIRLANLYLKTGRLDKAKQLAFDALQTNEADALVGLVPVFARAGQKTWVCEWLATAVRRSKDTQTRFQLERELLRVDSRLADQPIAEFAREMCRLRSFARGIPALETAYAVASVELAGRRGADAWIEGELQRAWQDGRGNFSAGELLVSFYLDHHQTEPLRRVVQAIDQRPNLPELSLFNLQRRLVEAGLSTLALPLSERLNQRFPDNEAYLLNRAQVLSSMGRAGEADGLLESLDLTWIVRDDPAARIGALYQELGNTDRAREFYLRAIQRDSTAIRSRSAYFRLAQIEAERGNWPKVRRLLRTVYAPPAAGVDLHPLAEYLSSPGRPAGEFSQRRPGGEFALTFSERARLLGLIFEPLNRSGPVAATQTFITTHAAFLSGSPALAAAFRKDLSAERIPVLVDALEAAVSQSDPPTPRLKRELAALYVQWSDRRVNGDSHDTSKRLAQLTRANQLVPNDFEVARRLAALWRDTGESARSASVLEPFLAADAVPGETRQARQLLAHH